MSNELRRTPLFARQQALGGRFVGFAGWEMPVQFAGVAQEHAAVRNHAGLFDVSHMGELWVEGPSAVADVDRLVTNNVAALPVGTALYTVCCNDGGTILDDLIIYRVTDTRLLVVCNASNRDKIAAHFAAQIRNGFTDRSDATALLAIQGPATAAIVEQLGGKDIVALPKFGVMQAHLADVPVLAARTGYTGEDGFELFCDIDRVGALWDHLMSAGQPLGLQAIGLGARDTLRLEARLSLYGNEIDETTNPLEAGLGWVVKLGKGPFVGRDALQGIKQAGLSRRLIGFAMVGRGIARHGYPIVDDSGRSIGTVTSGAPGLSVGRNIGLGYVPAEFAALGSNIWVSIRDKAIEAEVVSTPFYKRQR